MTLTLVALVCAFLVSLIATPIARKVSARIGLVDHPDSHRKLHREPIALCGGPVLILALFSTFVLMMSWVHEEIDSYAGSLPILVSTALGAIALVAIGMWDDRFTLRGSRKLLGQIVICACIISSGVMFQRIELFGFTWELGLLTVPVTLGWLLLSINSINLIDGADGLCSSVGWISMSALMAIALFYENPLVCLAASSMAGGLLGFLIFNLPPARVFLGDSGSMLVGLMLGVLTIRGCTAPDGTVSILVPLALMSIPFFDSTMAIVRRKLTGRSIFAVDRAHLHHNLMRIGFKNHKLVMIMTLLCVITSAGAVLGVVLRTEALSLLGMMIAFGSLVITRSFGYAELELVMKRGSGLGRRLLRTGSPAAGEAVHQQTVRLQGSRRWENVWATLAEFAEKHQLSRVSFDLNIPWLHEGFHAQWQEQSSRESTDRWEITIPIGRGSKIFGRVEAVGYSSVTNVQVMHLFVELLEDLVGEIEGVLEAPTAAPERLVASV